ncbi:hypothetical protein ACFB49_10210 [Sphingomonas sp. DBB INV C78]
MMAATLAATAVAAPAYASTVIDFDNFGTYAGGAYHEDGFVLSGNFCNSTTGKCLNAVAPGSSIDSDGVSVQKASGAATTFTMQREDGAAFQFGSLEFGKLSTAGSTYSSTYQFFFTLADADQTVVTKYFTFLHSNPTPITAHLATFDGLGDILKFTFRNQSTAGQFDNITLLPATAAAVPEPATWAMMISGFGLVGGAMRRRAKVQPLHA